LINIRGEVAAAENEMLRTVLLAEDDAVVRALVEKILTAAGYSVIASSNGAEASELAAQHPGQIDVLISDVVMPGLSGVELAKQLQAKRPHSKVLLISGYFPEGLEFVEDWRFLPKPFSPSGLPQALDNLLTVA
jgi:two-component system cell cycle sensor histidine kinase/response regulator CckA